MKSLCLDPLKVTVCLARQKMTRSELCKRTGISEGNMSVIMNRRTVRPKTAGVIADALKVDVTEIIALQNI